MSDFGDIGSSLKKEFPRRRFFFAVSQICVDRHVLYNSGNFAPIRTECCVSSHRSEHHARIMRWWGSNLRQRMPQT